MLQAYGDPLSTVSSLQYLVRVLKVENDEWAAVILDLSKARKCWAQMLRIMGLEGANTCLLGLFTRLWYKPS